MIILLIHTFILRTNWISPWWVNQRSLAVTGVNSLQWVGGVTRPWRNGKQSWWLVVVHPYIPPSLSQWRRSRMEEHSPLYLVRPCPPPCHNLWLSWIKLWTGPPSTWSNTWWRTLWRALCPLVLVVWCVPHPWWAGGRGRMWTLASSSVNLYIVEEMSCRVMINLWRGSSTSISINGCISCSGETRCLLYVFLSCLSISKYVMEHLEINTMILW